jgi:hypothetical protein
MPAPSSNWPRHASSRLHGRSCAGPKRCTSPRSSTDEAQGQRAIASFDAGLASLESGLRLDSEPAIAGALEAALAFVPFNLHYLPGEHLERQSRYARLVARVARAAVPAQPVARASGKVRVGFVSSYMRTHVVARFFAASMTGLDPARFERWAWHTGGAGDAWTREIAQGVEHFDDTRTHVQDLVAAIRAAGLDVLVYLDVGLDPLQGVLAALRLAPVQAALYGHPASTGLDTIDDFVSGELLEPEGAESHYRESLVRLPGLGAKPRAPVAPGDGSWMRALRAEGIPLAVCAQNLQKLPPAFDATLAQIAAASRARLVFFDRGPGLTRRFSERLSRALSRGRRRCARASALRTRAPLSRLPGGPRRSRPRARFARILGRCHQPRCARRGRRGARVRGRPGAWPANQRHAAAGRRRGADRAQCG